MLWQPSSAFRERTELVRYLRWLETPRGVKLTSYDALWRWSHLVLRPDVRQSLWTVVRLAKGPSSARARPARLSPLEFMQRLAALVPRPRLHLIRFHGVLAPNAKRRALVVPQGPEPAAQAAPPAEYEAKCAHHRPVRLSWAKLLKRVFGKVRLNALSSLGVPARRDINERRVVQHAVRRAQLRYGALIHELRDDDPAHADS